jgi:hypothetical protein
MGSSTARSAGRSKRAGEEEAEEEKEEEYEEKEDAWSRPGCGAEPAEWSVVGARRGSCGGGGK